MIVRVCPKSWLGKKNNIWLDSLSGGGDSDDDGNSSRSSNNDNDKMFGYIVEKKRLKRASQGKCQLQ